MHIRKVLNLNMWKTPWFKFTTVQLVLNVDTMPRCFLGSEWVGPGLVVWHSPWFRVSGAPDWWCDTVLGSEWVGPLLGGVTVRPPWQQSQYGNDNLPWPLWEDDKSSRSYYPWFQEVVVKCWIHKGLKYSRQSVNLGGLWNHVSSFCAQVLVPLITLKYLCIM